MKIPLLGTLVLLFACSDKAVPDTAAVTDAPTWSQDVAPIFAAKCMGCHQEGALGPMRLDSYADASQWGAAAVDASFMGLNPCGTVNVQVPVVIPAGVDVGEEVPIHARVTLDGETFHRVDFRLEVGDAARE